jgi:hypothetical protein
MVKNTIAIRSIAKNGPQLQGEKTRDEWGAGGAGNALFLTVSGVSSGLSIKKSFHFGRK